MEPNTPKEGGRRLRSREEILKLLEDYENSDGISVREYCDMIGISDATFYNWQKRYGNAKEPEDIDADFIPIEITGSADAGSALQMEVKVIKFYGHLSAEQFKALLS